MNLSRALQGPLPTSARPGWWRAALLASALCAPLASCRADDTKSNFGAPDARDSALADADVGGGDAGRNGLPAGYVPAVDSIQLRCKLISDANLDNPTANDTHYRANLRGTDLGIPLTHGEDLFFFFGDTAGVHNIWPLGPESLPDAVGYASVPASEVAANPEALCSELRFLTTGGASGPVESDFAAGFMNPPAGHDISEFIHNPSGPRGQGLFPNLPGDFEVPSGAFSYQGAIYLFYTIINQDPFEMRGSYLAKWSNPSTAGAPVYDILHHVDQRFTEGGALGGDFINIAALVDGQYVYMYGTGPYRASNVQLARKKLVQVDQAGGYQRFDRESNAWVDAALATAPLLDEPTPNIGELSVQYFPEIDRYVMLDQEYAADNLVVARFSEKPEGPWSKGVTVASMSDPGFRDRFCCAGTDCSGARLMECEHAGFYGTYMLPELTMNADESFSIHFTMSTWIPYNVALMTATFR